MSLNKVMLIGNLGHDPEIRYMPASKRAVTNLSIAMNDSFTDWSGNREERTDWPVSDRNGVGHEFAR
jgi:single-strand DNA-binding protein